MKRLTFIAGAVFTSLTLMGILFKVMHWPGANVELLLGLAGLALVFIPSFTAYHFKRNSIS